MHVVARCWRPPVLGLAAALFGAGLAFGQSMPLAERLAQCSACHGEDGNSRTPNIPSLAGQPAFFVLNQLFLMREGVRKVEAMAAIVKDLTDPDLEALSQHFAKLPPKASDEPIDPALAKRGAEVADARRCNSCHGPTLGGQEQVPRVAKQRIDYLAATLKAFRDNPRPGADTLMSSAVAGLADADLGALAHYAASL
jgi:cytochrome c553